MILVLMKPGTMMNFLKKGPNKVFLFKRKKIDFILIIKLLNIIKKEKVDIIHTHQEIELFYAIFLKIIRPSVKLVHHIHSFESSKSVWFIIERIICNLFVSKVIAVSNSLSNYLIENGFLERKIVTIYNVVSITNELSTKDIELFRKKINYSENDFIIGMIGNFVKEKDQLTLGKAFKILLSEFKNLKLVFIGEVSGYAQQTKDLFTNLEINRNVFFTGQIPNANELIPLFDLMVLSSKTETFGIAALEALYCQKPVIASEIPAMIELSNNGKYFPLFPVGNYLRLAEIIRKYIKHEIDLNETKIARDYAIREFSIDNYVKKLAMVYNDEV